jgi:hypothetical protein
MQGNRQKSVSGQAFLLNRIKNFYFSKKMKKNARKIVMCITVLFVTISNNADNFLSIYPNLLSYTRELLLLSMEDM